MTATAAGAPRHARGPDTARPAGRRALVGSAVSLVGTTGVTAIFGIVFWWLAAHLLPVAAVGYGSAAISAMMLVGTFGMVGLNTVLIRELARGSRDPAGLMSAALYTSAVVSAVLGAAFVLLAVLVPAAAPYLVSPGHAIVFVAGSALTGATLVLDEALIGLALGSVQLWRNAAMAFAKLAALACVVILVHDRLGISILVAWTIGTALSIVPTAILAHHKGTNVIAVPRWRGLRSLARTTAGHTWLNNALQAPRLTLPLVVTGILAAVEGGAFYVAYTITSLAFLIPYHFTTALYASGSADRVGMRPQLRFTLRFSLLGGIVGVPMLIVLAHPMLQLFGSAYADRATLPMQILALGYFSSVVKNHYVAVRRVEGRITRAAWFGTVWCVVRLAAVAAGAVLGGLVGVAVALLLAMCGEGLAATPAVWKAAIGRGAGTARHRAMAGEGAAVPTEHRQVPVSPREPTVLTAPATVRSAHHPAGVRVCYYMQTHTLPEQVSRLVRVIKEGSPDSIVVISHDAAAKPLDVAALKAFDGVHVFTESGGYGDFSHLDRYFAAIDWLADHGVEYDWLENITGQDYPLLPIRELERTFAESDVDGYLLYSPVFPDTVADGVDVGAAEEFTLCAPGDAAMRYRYRHWRVGRPTPAKQRWLRPVMATNLVQPWLRVSLAFSTVGIRRNRTPFTPESPCYGGWFFCTLSAPCVRYVREYALEHPDVVDFFRATLAPEEVFLQTVLVNSRKFRFHPDAKRYIDLTGSRNNHSNVLGVDDLDAMLASGAHWARKFDPRHDARVLDLLDAHIGRGA